MLFYIFRLMPDMIKCALNIVKYSKNTSVSFVLNSLNHHVCQSLCLISLLLEFNIPETCCFDDFLVMLELEM